MKILMICGSPRENGCTYTALCEVAKAIEAEGIECEMFHIGASVPGCTGCGACRKEKASRCVIGDKVNIAIEKMEQCDGLIVGSPVYFAGINGTLKAFLDRMFYAGGGRFALKPAASLVSARRAGTTAALDQLNKYFFYAQMPIATSQYWNMVHGNRPEEVEQDFEGLQIMRTLGKNMAWLLKSIQAGSAAGIGLPEKEKRVGTNFIR